MQLNWKHNHTCTCIMHLLRMALQNANSPQVQSQTHNTCNICLSHCFVCFVLMDHTLVGCFVYLIWSGKHDKKWNPQVKHDARRQKLWTCTSTHTAHTHACTMLGNYRCSIAMCVTCLVRSFRRHLETVDIIHPCILRDWVWHDLRNEFRLFSQIDDTALCKHVGMFIIRFQSQPLLVEIVDCFWFLKGCASSFFSFRLICSLCC